MKNFFPISGIWLGLHPGALFKLLEALMDLAVPLVIAAMIDRGLSQADNAFLFHCSWGLWADVLGMGFPLPPSILPPRGERGGSLPGSGRPCSTISRACPTGNWIPWAPIP